MAQVKALAHRQLIECRDRRPLVFTYRSHQGVTAQPPDAAKAHIANENRLLVDRQQFAQTRQQELVHLGIAQLLAFVDLVLHRQGPAAHRQRRRAQQL